MKLRFALFIAGAGAALGCSGSSEAGGTGAGGAGSGGATQGGSGGTNGAGSAGKGNGGSPSSGGSSAGTSGTGTGGAAMGAACRVNDVVYPDGTGDFQDPFSCNQCSCLDGALACTRIGCPIECPTGTAPGTSCDSCGPADECEVVFHGCLEQCETSNDCFEGSCSEQVCRNLCG